MKPSFLAMLGVLGLAGLGIAVASSRKEASGGLPSYDTPPRSQAEANARLAELKAARPDANAAGLSFQADGYAQRFFYLDKSDPNHWSDAPQKWNTLGHVENKYDEYGRWVPTAGVSTDPMGTVLTAAGIALPFVPGVGPAASAALAAAVALGKGESLKDATLKAIRATLPMGGQVAFDLGVAVASGRPVDDAAVEAMLAQVPGGKEAYKAGESAWKTAKEHVS